jgi:hypothetical protein
VWCSPAHVKANLWAVLLLRVPCGSVLRHGPANPNSPLPSGIREVVSDVSTLCQYYWAPYGVVGWVGFLIIASSFTGPRTHAVHEAGLSVPV